MIREIYAGCLFLGNALDVRDLRRVYDHQIQAVVDLAIEESPAQLAREIIYVRVPLLDGSDNAAAIITTAIRCVAGLVENRIRTLVACSAGMSRSPAIAAAAMAILTKTTPENCLTTILAAAPHDVSPLLWSRVRCAFDEIVVCPKGLDARRSD